jgi:hypothetical protein
LLTITASNATMKYGSAVPVITASYNPPNPVGLTTQPACTTTATKTSPVGSYPATCAGAAGPYTFTYVAGTVSVTPVPLTIFAPNATMNYGGTVPTLNPLPATNYVGFVAGDTPANLTTQPACTTTATSTNTTPPGKYPSTCSGAVDRNYTISYVNGTVTVARGALTVATNSATRVYGAANPPITTISTGLAGGDTLASLGITCSTTAVASSPVSPPTYPITCAGPASTANYATITYTNPGALTITAVPLRITAGSLTVAYGAPKPAIAPSYSGFVLGQGPGNLTGLPTCSTTYTQGSPVGSYPSSCSGATSTNYTFNYVNGTVTVNRATTTTSITSHLPSPSTLKQPVVVAFAVAPQFTGTTPTGNVTVTASTGESCTGTVAAGNCSITTFNTAGTRTLTATYAGSSNFLGSTSAGVSQRVNAPSVSLSPNNMNFGNVTVNTTSPPSTATLTNSGAGALINLAWSITGTNASNFSIASTTCTATLAPGASCVFNITFKPSATGSRTASLTLTDNALNSPQSNGLSGRGR